MKNFFASLACLLGICLFVIGCGGSSNKVLKTAKNLEYAEPTELVQDINSETVALVHREHFRADGSVDDVYRPYCTGVWVSETTFITAYHCIKAISKAQGQSPVGAEIYFLGQKEVVNVFEQVRGTYKAHARFMDIEHDLAMVVADGKGPAHKVAHIPVQSPGIGTKMHFVGHVKGYYYTYVEGVVSSYRERFKGLDVDGPFMQVSAPISLGNSGGGVFDNSGDLVGIASFIAENAPNTAFYIPAPQLRKFLSAHKVKNQ